MNSAKFAFITYLPAGEHEHAESLRYIHALEIPDGYAIETIAVTDAPNPAVAYNQGMKQSDATYKVYLHPNARLIHKHMLQQILDLFTAHPRLGMLGVVGAPILSSSGALWESTLCCGQAIHAGQNGTAHLALHEPPADYQPVQALADVMLITRHDLPWREDLFPQQPYLAQSHCMEFIRSGYEVGVPRQPKPWLFLDADLLQLRNGKTKGRTQLLREYRTELCRSQPLVSVLIPATDKPRRLELAIRSVLHQSYSRIEVLVLDDGRSGDLEQRLAPFRDAHLPIRRIDLSEDTEMASRQRVLDACEGDYVTWLRADDLFHPEKIERMLPHLLIDPDLHLVSSTQQLIDGSGNALPQTAGTEPLFDKVSRVPGPALSKHVLLTGNNHIGSVSAPLFRRAALTEPWGTYGGNDFSALADLASWLGLLQNGHALYLPQKFSYVRQSEESSPLKSAETLAEMRRLLATAREVQSIADIDYKRALAQQYRSLSDVLLQALASDDDAAARQAVGQVAPLIKNNADDFIDKKEGFA